MLRNADIEDNDVMHTITIDGELYLEICNSNGIVRDIVSLEPYVDRVATYDTDPSLLYDTIEKSVHHTYLRRKELNRIMNLFMLMHIPLALILSILLQILLY